MLKHVSILIPRGHSSLVNIVGTRQILHQVNSFLEQKGRAAFFKVELVGISDPVDQSNGLFIVHPEKFIGDIGTTDLIIIPAIHDDPEVAVAQNQEFVAWLKQHYNSGTEIVSFCVAAFFLASTGLLDGRQCSTHWIHADRFRKMFPKVDLVDDRIMTEDGGIYSSGGAYSYLNLLLYLIQKYVSRDIAILTAKTFMIDIDKASQSPFIMFRGQKAHEDTLVQKAQEFIEDNFREKIHVEDLAKKFAISRRSFERRFKKATLNTVTTYIQRVKVEAAKRSLETSRENVKEVMYGIGYSDEKSFRNTFKRITGISPLQYRNKYRTNHLGA